MKTPQTGAQRQAAHKARMQAAGLVRFASWVHPNHAPVLRELIRCWLAKPKKSMSENG